MDVEAGRPDDALCGLRHLRCRQLDRFERALRDEAEPPPIVAEHATQDVE